MSWRGRLPAVRGRLAFDESLAPFTWLRVGGPAEALFLPADADDLAAFVAALDRAVPLTVLGVGSNTLVRDGGVEGVVVRLGRAFAAIAAEGRRIRAGAAALDAAVARAALEAGIAGLEFLTGVPGTVGGALTMNAGCYGRETGDVFAEARALDRRGRTLTLGPQAMGFAYRRAAAAEGLIFLEGVFEGTPGERHAIQAEMSRITASREAAQPIREKTGGSTFKNPRNPDGAPLSAWRLVDAAGLRGVRRGGAMFSPQHANFLINAENATAADLEGLGEEARAAVRRMAGVDLEWEIRRIGRPAAGAPA